MFQRFFQRTAKKDADSREPAATSPRPLPTAIPVPPSSPRPAPHSPPTSTDAAFAAQRLPAPEGPLTWQSLPGGESVGSGRVAVSPTPTSSQPPEPFPGWQVWESPSEPEPQPEAPEFPEWAQMYRSLDVREQELTVQIEELVLRSQVLPLADDEHALLQDLCQERAGVLLQKLETDPLQTVLPSQLDEASGGDWFFHGRQEAPPPAPPAPVPVAPVAECAMNFGFGVGPLEPSYREPPPPQPAPRPAAPAKPARASTSRPPAQRPTPAAPPRPARSFRRLAG